MVRLTRPAATPALSTARLGRLLAAETTSTLRLGAVMEPTVTLDAPTDGSVLWIGDSATFTATVTPGTAPVDQVIFQWDSGAYAAEGALVAGNVWSVTVTVPAWPAGAMTLRARVRDTRGRYGFSAPASVSVLSDAEGYLAGLGDSLYWVGDGSGAYVSLSDASHLDYFIDLTGNGRAFYAETGGGYERPTWLEDSIGFSAQLSAGRGIKAALAPPEDDITELTEVTLFAPDAQGGRIGYFMGGYPGAYGNGLRWEQTLDATGAPPGEVDIVRWLCPRKFQPEGYGIYRYATADTDLHCYSTAFDGGALTDAGKLRQWFDGAAQATAFSGTIPSYLRVGPGTMYDALGDIWLGGGLGYVGTSYGRLVAKLLIYRSVTGGEMGAIHSAFRKLVPTWTS